MVPSLVSTHTVDRLTFMGPRIVNAVYKYNQQDATLYNIHYYCQCCTCFRLLLPLAVVASKLDIYQMLCTVLSSWWWAEKPPETCRALTIIKNIVQHCTLLVVLIKQSTACRPPITVSLSHRKPASSTISRGSFGNQDRDKRNAKYGRGVNSYVSVPLAARCCRH
jgi:hypothetical protein